MSRGGCQARMGAVVVPCAAAECRTFALDSRASAPARTTMVPAIQSASIPGEVPSPGPPPLRGATDVTCDLLLEHWLLRSVGST